MAANSRVRLTDRGYSPKTAAKSKQADPYLMNQDRRPQSEPAVDAYESGDPSSWAEDVHQPDTWKEEYAKGRDEIGQGNFLDSTWKDREHPGTPGAGRPQYENKTATEEALRTAATERAAELDAAKKVAKKALHLASAMFPQADEGFVLAQARDFMKMPEAALDTTIARIVGAGDDEEEEEAETKEAGKVPPQFLPGYKKDEDGDDKEDKDKKSSLTDLKVQLASIKASVGDNADHLTFISSLEARIAALEIAATDDEEEEEETKEASTDDRLIALAAGLDRLSGRSLVVAEEEEEEEEAAAPITAGDEEEEEEEETKEAANLDIELGGAEMDTTAGDGDLLDDIFLAAETSKTASAKPPKKGVSKLGGTSKTASGGGDVNLEQLWKSDPDVSQDFS